MTASYARRVKRPSWLLVSIALAGCPSNPPPVTPPGGGPEARASVDEPGGVEPGEPPVTDEPMGAGDASGGGGAGGPSSTTSLGSQLVAAHNLARAEHCAPPLEWSDELSAVAQRWAAHLRDHGCAFEHSDSNHGENLAAGTAGTLDARAVVGMWVDEREAYDFTGGGFSMETGHFTQVVWRDTRRVGCGVATCKGMDLFVCNYDPPGNVDGGYDANVAKRCK